MDNIRPAAQTRMVFETYLKGKTFTNGEIGDTSRDIWSPRRLEHVDVMYIFKIQRNGLAQLYVAKDGNP